MQSVQTGLTESIYYEDEEEELGVFAEADSKGRSKTGRHRKARSHQRQTARPSSPLRKSELSLCARTITQPTSPGTALVRRLEVFNQIAKHTVIMKVGYKDKMAEKLEQGLKGSPMPYDSNLRLEVRPRFTSVMNHHAATL